MPYSVSLGEIIILATLWVYAQAHVVKTGIHNSSQWALFVRTHAKYSIHLFALINSQEAVH